MNTRTDTDITADVLAELIWDPSVNIADMDVTTKDGYVWLSGTTSAFTTKDAAEGAAFRVYGVRDVTNSIVVDPSLLGIRPDSAIQADVHSAMTLDTLVPRDRVTITVVDGIAILSGTLDYHFQREAAETDTRQIAGVIGVNNLIMVAPAAPIAGDVADLIAQAFARNAELDDDSVSVKVLGRKVTLGGTVRTWNEYDEAEYTAWRAPGVHEVVNTILVTF